MSPLLAFVLACIVVGGYLAWLLRHRRPIWQIDPADPFSNAANAPQEHV